MADMLLGGIVINEILVDPNGTLNFDTDGNGTADGADEFVELYNASAGAIDISGLELWDDGIGLWFTFPPGTILQAGAHAMVMVDVQAGGSLPTGAPGDLFFETISRTTPLINNGGDNITLYDPTNDEFIQARFNGDALDDPTLGVGGYSGFSGTATRIGLGEDFGNDTDGQSLQRTGDGTDTFTSSTPTPGVKNICFAAGTEIRTPSGPQKIETLTIGSFVETLDNGPQQIRWIGTRRISPLTLKAYPELRPIRIQASALGCGLPKRDLLVSPQHRIMVSNSLTYRMFGAQEVLVAAKHLTELDGIDVAHEVAEITYVHFLCDRHEVVFAQGAASETLYTGAEALKSVSKQARDEIFSIFPSLLTCSGGRPRSARILVKGRMGRRMAQRLIKNNKMARERLCIPTMTIGNATADGDEIRG